VVFMNAGEVLLPPSGFKMMNQLTLTLGHFLDGGAPKVGLLILSSVILCGIDVIH